MEGKKEEGNLDPYCSMQAHRTLKNYANTSELESQYKSN